MGEQEPRVINNSSRLGANIPLTSFSFTQPGSRPTEASSPFAAEAKPWGGGPGGCPGDMPRVWREGHRERLPNLAWNPHQGGGAANSVRRTWVGTPPRGGGRFHEWFGSNSGSPPGGYEFQFTGHTLPGLPGGELVQGFGSTSLPTSGGGGATMPTLDIWSRLFWSAMGGRDGNNFCWFFSADLWMPS